MGAPALKLNNSAAGDLDSLTGLHKALADSLRLQILRLLRSESFGVLELCRILDIKQSALSHHLKILANAGLVSTRREGNSIFYRRAFLSEDEQFAGAKRHIFENIDSLPVPTKQERKIKQIQLERSQLSLNFFQRNANKFREQQGLIVEHGDYAASIHDVIGNLGLEQDSALLEVGPGEGQLLVELAARYKNLTALDNSSDMLERSRISASEANFDHVNFILGDTAVACKKKLKFDLVLFNMVLHHISSPAKTFADCAKLLNDGGRLLIIELSSHDQDWVRESCGDLWLGFEENELLHWANKASLHHEQSSYLGLRNGFQIQMSVYKKEHAIS